MLAVVHITVDQRPATSMDVCGDMRRDARIRRHVAEQNAPCEPVCTLTAGRGVHARGRASAHVGACAGMCACLVQVGSLHTGHDCMGHNYIGHNYKGQSNTGHIYLVLVGSLHTGHEYIGHKHTGQNYKGHRYIGHNNIGHNYVGHNYMGHKYVGPNYKGQNNTGHNYWAITRPCSGRLNAHRP